MTASPQPTDGREAQPTSQQDFAMKTHIKLRPSEIQSGSDRVKWAEGLIRQLPENHDGRNSWLLNYAGEKHQQDVTSPPQPTSPSVDGEALQLKAWKNGRREPCTMQEFIDQIRTFGEFAIKQGSIDSHCPNSVHMGEMLIMAAAALSAPRVEPGKLSPDPIVPSFSRDPLVGVEPVAWRWKPRLSSTWIYDPEKAWLDLQSPAEINIEPLYAAHPAPTDTGWQPIETAPKDGTRILISNAGRFPKNTYVARWLKEAWQIGPLGEWSAYPTHWTPLPSFYSHPAPPDAGDRG